MLEALDSKSKDTRLKSVKRLGMHGTAAKKAVPALARLLRENADDVTAIGDGTNTSALTAAGSLFLNA